MNSTTSIIPPGMHSCAWCGPNIFHAGMCPRVTAVSYHETGALAHVDFDPTFPPPPDVVVPEDDANDQERYHHSRDYRDGFKAGVVTGYARAAQLAAVARDLESAIDMIRARRDSKAFGTADPNG